MHWAAHLIGKRWAPNAQGPDAYDCWNLIRHVFRVLHGLDMPAVRDLDDETGSVASIKRASEATGWRSAAAPAQRDDIVLMRDVTGRRHVGLVIEIGRGRLAVLHANGGFTPGGKAFGCVERQSFDELTADGCRDFEYWRRAQ